MKLMTNKKLSGASDPSLLSNDRVQEAVKLIQMLFTPPKCCLLGIYSGESQAVGPVPNFPIGAVVMRLASYKIRSALDPQEWTTMTVS